VIGGVAALRPVAGNGVERLSESLHLTKCRWQEVQGDLYFSGRSTRSAP
jgi:hypothetical protein